MRIHHKMMTGDVDSEQERKFTSNSEITDDIQREKANPGKLLNILRPFHVTNPNQNLRLYVWQDEITYFVALYEKHSAVKCRLYISGKALMFLRPKTCSPTCEPIWESTLRKKRQLGTFVVVHLSAFLLFVRQANGNWMFPLSCGLTVFLFLRLTFIKDWRILHMCANLKTAFVFAWFFFQSGELRDHGTSLIPNPAWVIFSCPTANHLVKRGIQKRFKQLLKQTSQTTKLHNVPNYRSHRNLFKNKTLVFCDKEKGASKIPWNNQILWEKAFFVDCVAPFWWHKFAKSQNIFQELPYLPQNSLTFQSEVSKATTITFLILMFVDFKSKRFNNSSRSMTQPDQSAHFICKLPVLIMDKKWPISEGRGSLHSEWQMQETNDFSSSNTKFESNWRGKYCTFAMRRIHKLNADVSDVFLQQLYKIGDYRVIFI